MKMEKRAKVVFGKSGCTLIELRAALDNIEGELGADCEIRMHTVPTNLPGNLIDVAAIAGFKMVGEDE